MKFTLSEDKQTLIISETDVITDQDEVVLCVGDVIDFRSAAGGRTYSGMIQKFQVPPKAKDSVWALMKETTGKLDEESISLTIWKQNVNNGLIRN